MDRVTGDRGDVDHAGAGILGAAAKGASEAPRHYERSEQVQFEDFSPALDIAVEASKAFFIGRFWRDRGVVDQRVQSVVTEEIVGFGNKCVNRPDI